MSRHMLDEKQVLQYQSLRGLEICYISTEYIVNGKELPIFWYFDSVIVNNSIMVTGCQDTESYCFNVLFPRNMAENYLHHMGKIWRASNQTKSFKISDVMSWVTAALREVEFVTINTGNRMIMLLGIGLCVFYSIDITYY